MNKNNKKISDKGKKLLKKLSQSNIVDNKLERAEKAVCKTISISLKQHEFDALVMLAYDITEEKFTQSEVVGFINGTIKNPPPGDLKDAWKHCNDCNFNYMTQHNLYNTGDYHTCPPFTEKGSMIEDVEF